MLKKGIIPEGAKFKSQIKQNFYKNNFSTYYKLQEHLFPITICNKDVMPHIQSKQFKHSIFSIRNNI